MKKTISIFLILLFIIPSFAFSLELGQKNEQKITEIALAAQDMDSAMRTAYYDANKKNSTGPVLLNLFLGFGIGSFVQGDTTGGVISLVGDVASYGVMGFGLYYYVSKSVMDSNGNPKISDRDGLNTAGLLLLGASLKLGFSIFEIYRASNYTRSYNSKLSSAISSAPIRVSLLPVIDAENNMGFNFAARVDF